MSTRFPFYPPDRQHDLETRVAEYTFEQNEPTAWTPLRGGLTEARVSIVTTAGLRLPTQHQFPINRTTGCSEYREISSYVDPSELAYDFTNYDPSEAQKDLNSLVPLDRLKEAADAGLIAGIHETFFSFVGLCTDLDALRNNVRAVAERLKENRTTVALVLTANFTCNQTGALIARQLEAEGIVTVLLATVWEIAEAVKVPRTLFVNFPFGRPFGPAGDTTTQRAVLQELFVSLRQASRPGRIRSLTLPWPGSER